MKDIVRFGVLSALLFATSLPAFSAPSDSDMGFAAGSEPTAADVGYQGVMTRGYRDDSGSSGTYAGAAQGDSGQMHRAQNNSDKLWFDQNRETSQYLQSTANMPYRANPFSQSQTKQHTFQQMTQGEKMVNPYAGTGQGSVSQALLSRMSTSDISFRGPQNLGFRGSGPLGWGTVRGANLFQFAPRTGTGSVNASICAPDGKQ
jgi:hypothetical protein